MSEIQTIVEFCNKDKLSMYALASLIRAGQLTALLYQAMYGHVEKKAVEPSTKRFKPTCNKFKLLNHDQRRACLQKLEPTIFTEQFWERGEFEDYQDLGFITFALNSVVALASRASTLRSVGTRVRVGRLVAKGMSSLVTVWTS
jgi:hypothetical protein